MVLGEVDKPSYNTELLLCEYSLLFFLSTHFKDYRSISLMRRK
jgi:hypothetical protein